MSLIKGFILNFTDIPTRKCSSYPSEKKKKMFIFLSKHKPLQKPQMVKGRELTVVYSTISDISRMQPLHLSLREYYGRGRGKIVSTEKQNVYCKTEAFTYNSE